MYLHCSQKKNQAQHFPKVFDQRTLYTQIITELLIELASYHSLEHSMGNFGLERSTMDQLEFLEIMIYLFACLFV